MAKNHATNISQCKVCNSQLRSKIEELHIAGMPTQKIHEYLQNLSDPTEQAIVQNENISFSSIYRHLKKHFNVEEGTKVAIAELRSRQETSRSMYREGIQIAIDKINAANYMIEMAMNNIEELEKAGDPKRHQATVQYMGQIRGYIETLGKLTGELRQEGTVDISFFNSEIHVFADIVLESVREVDTQLGLGGALEAAFASEFKHQWEMFSERQRRLATGELSVQDAQKDHTINKFNQG